MGKASRALKQRAKRELAKTARRRAASTQKWERAERRRKYLEEYEAAYLAQCEKWDAEGFSSSETVRRFFFYCMGMSSIFESILPVTYISTPLSDESVVEVMWNDAEE